MRHTCHIFIAIVAGAVVGAVITMFTKTTNITVNLDPEAPAKEEQPWVYEFMPSNISKYICEYSEKLNIPADLVVAILLQENPDFKFDAVHRNENGTIDCGLFQLNDKYIWSDFIPKYWQELEIDFNPFNWKHNTFIAIRHIKFLLDSLKVQDDVIMAYNCGIGAVMNERIPSSTFVYLSRVKNNLEMLRRRNVTCEN